MRILVICQHYWPEPYPLPDICEELARRGHQVDVITDVPNYPMGFTYPEYRCGRNRQQEHNGVKITRVFTIPRRHDPIFRVLNYYSYAVTSTLKALMLKEEYDVVFTNQTSPVMMSNAAAAYARKYRKKVVMYCMDIWPACLAAGGLEPDSPVYRLFGGISGKIYRKMDRILITSQLFRNYLITNHHVQPERIEHLPQYAADAFTAIPEGGKKDTVDLMFAGNIGAAQSLDTVLKAAEILKDVENLRWHIVGDGSQLERLKAEAAEKNLDQVIFYGRRPAEKMPELYAKADAMLVTLSADEFISMTLPGKVQTYMAAGKPIIGAANGEIPVTIAQANCGYCAKAEDAEGLAEAVKAFLETPNKAILGANARAFYKKHYTRKMFMDRLEAELMGNCV